MPPVTIDVRRAEDTRDVVHRAVEVLSAGELVVFPTETVYGVAAAARVPVGVERLIKAKGRGADAPFALAIKSAEEALDFVPRPGRLAERLARRCWPGPVTLVMAQDEGQGLTSQLHPNVQKAVAPNGTVGLRVPAHHVLLDVLDMLAGPLALTSANRTGQTDSTSAAEAIEQLGDSISLVLDDGPSRYGQPSTVVQADDQSYNCLREGVVANSALERLASMIVVFACTGNTCRSPMAEVLFRHAAAQKLGCTDEELEQKGVIVSSAGVAASAGGAPSREAVDVMKRKGLDLSKHCSQPISDKLARHADVIYTMTNGHRHAIVRRWPDASSRTETLRMDGQDIDDPIGGSPAVYERCAEQIEAAIKQRIEVLELR